MFIRERYGNRIEDSRFAPEADLEGHVDLKRLIEGRVGGIFLSAYVGWSVTVRAHYLVDVLIAAIAPRWKTISPTRHTVLW